MSVSKTRGFLAGAAGGVLAVAVLFAYRYATGMPTLQEALAERMILLLPYQVFALILEHLQHLAKPLGLVMSVITTLVGFGLGGVLYAGVAGRARETLGVPDRQRRDAGRARRAPRAPVPDGRVRLDVVHRFPRDRERVLAPCRDNTYIDVYIR